MKLYELTSAYTRLEAMLEEDTDDTSIATYLDACEGALREKATNIAFLVQNLETTSEAIAAAEKRMAERRKAIDNRVKRIKDYVLRSMLAAGISKIECEYFRIGIRNNPSKVVIEDPAAVPIQYLRQPPIPAPEPDKKAMLADIKQGVVIDGVRVEQGQSLVIQ